MKMKVLLLVLLFGLAYAKHEEYIGWKSYFVEPSSQEQLRTLRSADAEYELDFLSHPSVGRPGLALVKPQFQTGFLKFLEDNEIRYNVFTEDVKAELDHDDEVMEARKRDAAARNMKQLPYNDYQDLETIYAYIDDIGRRFPNTVTVVNDVTSFEGRPIKYLRISTTNFQDTSKPVIFIDGGIHAREWISPPTVTWAIRKLTEDVTDPDLLQRFDWILVPVANPDGYRWTFTNSRFWRKTRSTDQNVLSGMCPGVDGNRNYDFFWNTVGSSSNPCLDTYAGSRAFSEVETRLIRDLLLQYRSRIALYLTMHSYGSMILFPWGHDGTLSGNAANLLTVGVAMVDAIHTIALPSFPRYVVGNSLLVIGYGASGASEDYAHSIGIPLTYTYELPGLSGGLQGFHLDPRFIQQVAEETWLGIAAGARAAGNLFRP